MHHHNLLLAAVLMCIVTSGPHAADVTPQKPNIILILTDDQGWADLGAQGIQKDIRTPNLDKLAAGGLRATNGYATAPQCVPSRAGILTGRYQNRFGVEANTDKLDGFKAQTTIAKRLKTAGYTTGMSGKWHLGPMDEIVERGFDDVYCTQLSIGMRLRGWANFDLKGNTMKGGPITNNDAYHLDANTQATCAFIKRHQKSPFFFYLAYRGPHVPLDAPEKYTSRFTDPMPNRRKMALGSIAAIDDGVGQIMETLRSCGLEEKTLMFFMSDNGAPLKITRPDDPITGNGSDAGWDGSLNAPMNGEKGMLTEGGIREPWIAYWKGTIPAGQVYTNPVISLDVAATACAIAGLSNDQLDGVNLLPYFTGKEKGPPHDVLYWRWVAQAAVREGSWKFLTYGTRQYLFNIVSDPGEKNNLIKENPDIATRLLKRLQSWSEELQPAGLSTKSMPAWEVHYNYFLDHKPLPVGIDAQNKQNNETE